MAWIYKITNSINNKIYIGQTHYSIKERWRQHKYVASHPEHVSYNSPLYQAFRKYGLENFILEPVEECAEEKLDDREIYWINYYNSYGTNGYNATLGGKGNRIYKEEDIKTLWDKKYNLKKICDELNISVNTVKKILNDYPPFIEEREQRYLEASSDKSYESIPVKQFTLKGEYITTYPSIAEAERQTGANKSCIIRVCKGRNKYANNFQWRYADDDTPVTEVKARNIPIMQIDENNNIINEFTSIAEAARINNFSKSMVTYAVKHGTFYNNFYWRKKEEL